MLLLDGAAFKDRDFLESVRGLSEFAERRAAGAIQDDSESPFLALMAGQEDDCPAEIGVKQCGNRHE